MIDESVAAEYLEAFLLAVKGLTTAVNALDETLERELDRTNQNLIIMSHDLERIRKILDGEF